MVLLPRKDNHIHVTLPKGVIRDVFARDHPDALLHLLASKEEPPLYTHARDTLGLRPEEFLRALEQLEKWGLVHLRVLRPKERPDQRRRVSLELTLLGRAVVRFHDEMDASWTRIAADQGLAADALASA